MGLLDISDGLRCFKMTQNTPTWDSLTAFIHLIALEQHLTAYMYIFHTYVYIQFNSFFGHLGDLNFQSI